jgi:MFS transporter, DHA1 family, tetracycline resistance protein
VKKTSLLIVFLSVFIDLVGFGIVLPLLPIYSQNFGAGGLMIGLIIASYSAMQFLFAPAWGRLSDRIGRRPVILVSNAGAAGSYALFAVASTMSGSTGLALLMLSRIFAGICGASLSVASAYIADISPPEKRSKGMGLIGMAFGLGFIFGPAIGALSAHQFGMAGPGWVAASVCAANFLFGFFILGESLKPSSEPAVRRPKWTQWSHTLRQPKVGLLIGIFFLATFCFTCFETTFPLLITDKFGYGEGAYIKVGLLFAFSGIVAAIVQGGLIGRLVIRFGEQRLIFTSLLILAFALALLPYQTHLAGMMFVLAMFAAGSGLNRPPVFGLISINTSAAEQGATLGVAQSIGALARIVGPIFASTLYAVQPPLPYLICAGIALLAGLLSWQYLCRPLASSITAREHLAEAEPSPRS